MKTNWDIVQHNTRVAGANYYGNMSMAQVTLIVPHVGVIGCWWCPVEYKDALADRVAQNFKADFPSCEVRVSFPNLDTEGAKDLFDSYVFEGNDLAVCAA